MQKNSHEAADWFPKYTAECISLMLNPKTNANLCPLPAWFPKSFRVACIISFYYKIKYLFILL